MGTISFKQGRGNRIHNLRRYPDGKMPKNIHTDKTPENVIWHDETLTHAYHRIFDKTVEEYNSKQNRNDRKIKDYQSKIKNSKNGEKLFYEDVIQWGDKEIFEKNPELKQVAKECLLEYLDGFRERNPNLEVIGAYIHMDEASPHLHLDYIPVATGYKSGMKKRNAIDRAMKNLGFGKNLRDGKDNATKQWKEAERKVLREICVRHDLIVDAEVQTPEREDLSVLDYKKEMRSLENETLQKENKELELRKSELEKVTKELRGEVLTTAEVNNLDIKKPLLLQNTKVQYKMLADLKSTARKIDEIRYECALKSEKADEKMQEAEKVEKTAMNIIENEKKIYSDARRKGDDYIEECKSKARDEASAEKKNVIDKFNDTIATLKAKIIELKEEIKALLSRKTELETEVNTLEETYDDKVQEVSLIIEAAEIKSEEIIQDALDKKYRIEEYGSLQELFGIVSAEKYYRVKKHLKETYNELINYYGEAFLSKFPDVYNMDKDDLLDFADSKRKNYGRSGAVATCELLATICEAYDDIKDKPRIWKEEPAKTRDMEKAKIHRLVR